jgi:hypothetical protein
MFSTPQYLEGLHLRNSFKEKACIIFESEACSTLDIKHEQFFLQGK